MMYDQNQGYNNQQAMQPPQMTPQELNDFVQLEEAVKQRMQLNPQQIQYYNQLREKAIAVQQYQQQMNNGGYVQQNNQYTPGAAGGGYVQNNYNQRPMAPQNNQYIQPNNQYVQPNNQYAGMPQHGGPFVQNGYNAGPAVTSGHSDSHSRYSSNSNNMKDKVALVEANQPAQTEKPVAIAEPAKPFESMVPLEGYEYPFLTIPTQVAVKETIGDYFIYSIHDKKDEEVDFNKHASIYKNSVTGHSQEIDLEDVKKINFINDLSIVDTYREAFNKVRLANGDNEHKSIFNAGVFIMLESGVVNKPTNDSTVYMFKDLVDKSKDFRDLGKLMYDAYSNGGEYTKNTFTAFNENITKFINLIFRNALGSEIKIDSFMEDIDDLFVHVGGLKDARKRTIYNGGLADVYNVIKKNTTDIKGSVDEEDKVLGKKVGLTYLSNRVTIATTNSDDIGYELTDIVNNKVMFIQNDLTPALFAGVTAIFDKKDFNNKVMILLAKDGGQYRVMKTKLSVDYTIEKLK